MDINYVYHVSPLDILNQQIGYNHIDYLYRNLI